MKIEKVHFQSEGMKVVGNLFKPIGNSKEKEEKEKEKRKNTATSYLGSWSYDRC